jgi:splicing factor 3A subunit 1
MLTLVVELLDPMWKDQRAKAEARNATTNLSTVDVANNLKRLASQRSDVFDHATGQPLSEEELARRKKANVAHHPQRDGGDGGPPGSVPPPPSGQPVNVEEQIRMIHQRFAGGDRK